MVVSGSKSSTIVNPFTDGEESDEDPDPDGDSVAGEDTNIENVELEESTESLNDETSAINVKDSDEFKEPQRRIKNRKKKEEKNSGSVTLTPKAKEDPSNIYTTNIQEENGIYNIDKKWV